MTDDQSKTTGWRPIDTAPTDVGFEAELLIPPFPPMRARRIAGGAWHTDPANFVDGAGNLRASLFHPTHWRPPMSEPRPEMTGRCASCQWWDSEPYSEGMGVRRCTRIPQWWDATTWDDELDRVWTPEAQGMLAFANDGSSYRASLLTLPDFGCVMWEPANV